MPKNNVIDLNERRKALQSQNGLIQEHQKKGKLTEEIVDITEMRKEIITQERRQIKRTILTEFIGAFVIVPTHGLVKVAVYDISQDGISFDMEGEQGRFKMGEEVALRVYLNQNTYFSFMAKIHNIRAIEEENITRHGGAFGNDTINREALSHFVKFIETVSASLERDGGDIMVSNLK